MERKVGTVVRGIRAPIIREGDDLARIVVGLGARRRSSTKALHPSDRDVVAVTEAVVARAQGNYATCGCHCGGRRGKSSAAATVGVIFPILSRNRFAICLRGIARGP